MKIRIVAALLALLVVAAPDLAAQTALEADGAASLGTALRRLGTTKRVLMIAAHPDDENTALIAELALGQGADVAYLSLTRGEGGQNLIGPELQEGLGLIRSEELLAGRRLDGALQFFTRAYDYGFSKSADEAFSQWPRDSLLADVVAVIRRYRPDIIVSVFGGTPADGHGQHQAAGILARDAFTAAADGSRFPGAPHAAHYLFQVPWRGAAQAAVTLAVGDLDPLFGRSRYQIAMQSRSRHRSQDMGRAEPLGPQAVSLTVMAGDFPAHARSPFAGIDTTLVQHARTAAASAEVVANLERYENAVAALRQSFNPLQRNGLADRLVPAVRALDVAASLLNEARYAGLARLIRDERAQAADALRLDAGVVIDVTASTPTPVPGTSFDMTVTVWNGGTAAAGVSVIGPALPPGWTWTGNTGTPVNLAPNEVLRRTYTVSVPDDAARTEPWFLRNPRTAAVYDWTGAPDSLRTLPFAPPAIGAHVGLVVGAYAHVTRAAEFALVDKAYGEVRTPLIVVPAASVSVEPRVAAIPQGDASPRIVTVHVSAARDSVRGTARLTAPQGWRVAPVSAPVNIERAGGSQSLTFTVTPAPSARGSHALAASFESDGHTYTDGYSLISYPHIRPHPLYAPAEVRASIFPVQIAQGLRIGYIEGAGDDGAQALRQLGAVVEQLDANAVANGDLSRYDAIVAGIRAYEVRQDLLLHNHRLLEYARRGGTFVVQYNKYELVEGSFMPFPATMARPHGRITDENAAVTLLQPAHRALSWPNRITASDFGGWVQERGLYYLDTFDDRYEPLLSMRDPGEEPLTGGLVVARVGTGWYVYTGLALFRQLPEGVPGAFRLLANLVSLGKPSITP